MLNLCANDVGTCTRRRSRSSSPYPSFFPTCICMYKPYSVVCRIPLRMGMCVLHCQANGERSANIHTHTRTARCMSVCMCVVQMKWNITYTSRRSIGQQTITHTHTLAQWRSNWSCLLACVFAKVIVVLDPQNTRLYAPTIFFKEDYAYGKWRWVLLLLVQLVQFSYFNQKYYW